MIEKSRKNALTFFPVPRSSQKMTHKVFSLPPFTEPKYCFLDRSVRHQSFLIKGTSSAFDKYLPAFFFIFQDYPRKQSVDPIEPVKDWFSQFIGINQRQIFRQDYFLKHATILKKLKKDFLYGIEHQINSVRVMSILPNLKMFQALNDFALLSQYLPIRCLPSLEHDNAPCSQAFDHICCSSVRPSVRPSGLSP